MIIYEQEYFFKNLKNSKDWTLFLDRDGVINEKIEGDYVRNWNQFKFIPKVIDALIILKNFFRRIIIVTNQRGIGRGLMTYQDLQYIHKNMIDILRSKHVVIDAIYYCPHDPNKEICNCRKPKIGMALKAKENFPDIDFSKSIMVGDSISDIEFAYNSGMYSIFLKTNQKENIVKPFLKKYKILTIYKNLYEFAKDLEYL